MMMKAAAMMTLAVLLPACGKDSGTEPAAGPAPTPTPQPTDPQIETFPSEGSTHVPVGTVIVYNTDPPTSGDHYPDPQNGGYFETEIAAPYLVHSMEHGGVIIYYNPATVTKSQKDDLKALARAYPGIFDMVICVPRNDAAYPIILTAWTHRYRLPTYDQSRIDAFIALYRGHGPEAPPMPSSSP
jgi:predicted outer membrane protein